MDKWMFEFRVTTNNDGLIEIRQEASLNDGPEFVLHPDQVDLFIKVLKDAQRELLMEPADPEASPF